MKLTDKTFNNQRYIALAMFIISAIGVWYGVLLMTNPVDDDKPFPKPTGAQWIGFGFALMIAIISWVGRAFTIIPDSGKISPVSQSAKGIEMKNMKGSNFSEGYGGQPVNGSFMTALPPPHM
jgi:hypothetical protein